MYSHTYGKLKFYFNICVLIVLYSSSSNLGNSESTCHNPRLASAIKKYYLLLDCFDTQHHVYLGSRYNTEYNKNGDTTTQDDTVQNQYLSLPYPAVTIEELIKENKYYSSGKKDMPYESYPVLDLEYINHFLYNGGNDFR